MEFKFINNIITYRLHIQCTIVIVIVIIKWYLVVKLNTFLFVIYNNNNNITKPQLALSKIKNDFNL